MSSGGSDATPSLVALQRELILAQITLQELEDAREELLGRLAEQGRLQREAQDLADRALADHDHLATAHRDLLAHRDHLQHVLHVTNEALESTRSQLRTTENDLAAAKTRSAELEADLKAIQAEAARLSRELAATAELAAQRAARIGQLDGELRAMKSSRSWRWTAWLRSLERTWRRTFS